MAFFFVKIQKFNLFSIYYCYFKNKVKIRKRGDNMLPTDAIVRSGVKSLLFHKSNAKLIVLSIIMTLIAIIDVGIRNDFWDLKNGYWGFVNLEAVSDYCERRAEAH